MERACQGVAAPTASKRIHQRQQIAQVLPAQLPRQVPIAATGKAQALARGIRPSG